MNANMRLLQVIACLFFIFFLSGCIDIGSATNIKPENMKHLRIKGTLLYGSVETPERFSMNAVMIFFKNGPDLDITVHKPLEQFLVDLPTNCGGINRIGVRVDDWGTPRETWFYKEIPFTLQTNKINYLGCLVLSNVDMSMNKIDKMSFTSSYLDDDREDFYTNYPGLSKYEFYQVELNK